MKSCKIFTYFHHYYHWPRSTPPCPLEPSPITIFVQRNHRWYQNWYSIIVVVVVGNLISSIGTTTVVGTAATAAVGRERQPPSRSMGWVLLLLLLLRRLLDSVRLIVNVDSVTLGWIGWIDYFRKAIHCFFLWRGYVSGSLLLLLLLWSYRDDDTWESDDDIYVVLFSVLFVRTLRQWCVGVCVLLCCWSCRYDDVIFIFCAHCTQCPPLVNHDITPTA